MHHFGGKAFNRNRPFLSDTMVGKMHNQVWAEKKISRTDYVSNSSMLDYCIIASLFIIRIVFHCTVNMNYYLILIFR